MAKPTPSELGFHPEWFKDDVPWWWLVTELDKSALVQLATARLEARKMTLEAELKAITQSISIIRSAKAG